MIYQGDVNYNGNYNKSTSQKEQWEQNMKAYISNNIEEEEKN